jgi:hypothetical protein
MLVKELTVNSLSYSPSLLFSLLYAPLSRFSHNIQVSGITTLKTFHIPAIIVFIQEYITTTAGTPFQP